MVTAIQGMLDLTKLNTKGPKLPSKMVLHGVEGVGKTSFFGQGSNCAFLMSRGETGLLTLLDSGQVKPTAYLPEILTWEQLLASLDAFLEQDHDHKMLVIDTLNGMERLCHEYVCKDRFKSDWGPKGFGNFQQGYDSALSDWRDMLYRLDRIRDRGIAVGCIAHTVVRNHRNPEGADFDRWVAALHPKTWTLTAGWADMILFANYVVHLDEDGPRAKGFGGTDRVLNTQRSASWDAKNRHGLPEEIDMGDSASEAWKNFTKAIKDARK